MRRGEAEDEPQVPPEPTPRRSEAEEDALIGGGDVASAMEVDANTDKVDANTTTDPGCYPNCWPPDHALLAWNAGTFPTTAYDAEWSFTAPWGHVLGHIESWHHNKAEDRQWSIGYKMLQFGQTGYRAWSGWGNSFDGYFKRECGKFQVLVGIHSYHHNGAEDRRWEILCGNVDANCEGKRWWTDTLNSYDGHMTLNDMGQGQLLVGMESWHNNQAEDRQFKWAFTSYTKCSGDR